MVVPLYNEEANVAELHRRLIAALEPLDVTFELICVDDGSRDKTFDALDALHATDPRLRVIRLSRNFGKECAMTAGLDVAVGEHVALLDGDLQHPPESIPEMLARARDGYDVVYAVRRSRRGQSTSRRIASNAFHRLLRRIVDVDVVDGAGDFRVMHRSVVLALRRLRESQRYMKGLFAWAGFRTSTVEFDQADRAGGESRWSVWSLVRLALEAVTSFSTFPLRLVSYAGVAIAVTAVSVAAYSAFRCVVRGEGLTGFPTFLVAFLVVSAVQLISLGIMGEYIGRTYVEAKRRPLYVVRDTLGVRDDTDGGS